MPENSLEGVIKLFERFRFTLKISKPRISKLGDYRAPQGRYGHRISVNSDLNPYNFLITFVHEIAHLSVREKYGGKVLPHGAEWKDEYRMHLMPFVSDTIFPHKVIKPLITHLNKPPASSCADAELLRVLNEYDEESDYVYLEELPVNSTFILKGGRTFIKGEKIRKRYKCFELPSKAVYTLSPVSEVMPIGLAFK